MAARPRFDWFQTDELVTVTILKRGVSLEQCQVSFAGSAAMTIRMNDDVIFEGTLFGEVKQSDITLTCTPAKVEVRLPKCSSLRWPSLLLPSSSSSSRDGAAPPVAAPVAAPLAPPTVSFATKNWDAIEKAAVEEEEKEELEGDAAVNRMFRKIYQDASEDVRKAMMKSYSESGGTVLSTNWAEISKKKTEVKPPDSMEYKKFEQ